MNIPTINQAHNFRHDTQQRSYLQRLLFHLISSVLCHRSSLPYANLPNPSVAQLPERTLSSRPGGVFPRCESAIARLPDQSITKTLGEGTRKYRPNWPVMSLRHKYEAKSFDVFPGHPEAHQTRSKNSNEELFREHTQQEPQRIQKRYCPLDEPRLLYRSKRVVIESGCYLAVPLHFLGEK